MEKSYSVTDADRHQPWAGDFGFGASDRRYAYSRQSSFQQSGEPHTPISIFPDETTRPMLARTVSSIDMPPEIHKSAFEDDRFTKNSVKGKTNIAALNFVISIFNAASSGNRQMKRLLIMISLNVAYSTAELTIGLVTGRVGLVSDAFHLTFGCGLLTFSLFAMAVSRKKPDRVYTYGYKRIEVLAAFTNALFLLFMSFSLAVEALHAFIHEESEHKHYLIVSAVTDLLVNLIGVWFFRNYARITLVYRNAEDMNYHSVFLHVLADSIRSSGLILSSWFLSLGVANAEVLCLGLVSVACSMIVMPLFKASGGILLQMAPPTIPSSAFNKCLREVSGREDINEIMQARFWELVPGHVIGSLQLEVKEGVDDRAILEHVHSLYHRDLGVHDLIVQTH